MKRTSILLLIKLDLNLTEVRRRNKAYSEIEGLCAKIPREVSLHNKCKSLYFHKSIWKSYHINLYEANLTHPSPTFKVFSPHVSADAKRWKTKSAWMASRTPSKRSKEPFWFPRGREFQFPRTYTTGRMREFFVFNLIMEYTFSLQVTWKIFTVNKIVWSLFIVLSHFILQ